MKRKITIIYAILIILTLFRIFLAVKTPILVLSDQQYDDALLYKYSHNLINGNWLGAYNSLTLSKGISYSVLITMFYKLSIPYSLGMILLMIAGATYTCYALKDTINKYILYIIYILIIFLPSTFTTLISQRTYRNAILPTAVIFLFTSYIGLFLRKDKPIKESIPFLIGATVSLPFFWYIKEDSIWVLPFILTISLLIILYKTIKKENIIKYICILVIPFISLIFTTNVISLLNYSNYGIYAVSDKSNGEFSKMMTQLFSIRDNTNKEENIWISKNMLNKAYKYSPHFNKLHNDMKSFQGWTGPDGEVTGDYIIWKIRYVMAEKGYYKTATKANNFCKNVNKELHQAFQSKKISKDNGIHITSQMHGMKPKDILKYSLFAVIWYKDISLYDKTGLTGELGTGDIDMYNKDRLLFSSYDIHYSNQYYNYEKNNTINISNLIVNIYKFFSYIFFVLSVIGIISYSIKMLIEIRNKDYKKLNLWLITVGLLLSAFIVFFEVSMFTHFFSKDMLLTFRNFYCASAFPLLAISKYLSIYMLFILITEQYKKKNS